QPGLEPLEPAPGVRVQAGVEQVHDPIFTISLVVLYFTAAQVDRHTPREPVIVHEVALDNLALVAKCDQEFFEAEVAVMLHDVPQDRSATDLDHRLGPGLGFFGEPRTQAAGQKYSFHGRPQLAQDRQFPGLLVRFGQLWKMGGQAASSTHDWRPALVESDS